jgi:Domain of unknown function (DUF4337)
MNENELKELRECVAALKSDRDANKAKEQREAWTKYASLSIVCIAVLAAVATQRGGSCSSRVLVDLNDSTFNQAQASDQWSYYQAKSIKQSLAEMSLEQFQRTAGATPDAATAKVIEKNQAQVDRYEKEKTDITKQARGFERARDEAREGARRASSQGGKFSMAVSVFQISIAMASICLVMKRKPLWYLALLLAAVATAQMIHAMTL